MSIHVKKDFRYLIFAKMVELTALHGFVIMEN